MPSTALPGKFNEEVECDSMFYKQERNRLHTMDRCIRYAAGMQIPDKTMTSILDAHHPCWMQFEPAKALYSDGEGTLNNDAAKAAHKAKGTELRIRARGQRATTIEARSGILRYFLQVMETELKRLDITLMFTRLLHAASFAANAFADYSEVSPCSALFGWQPGVFPDLPVLDHEQPTETSDHSREQVICRACIEDIIQATAVAKTNRALRTKTTITGQCYYDEGDLVAYHRPTTTKDGWGGWNGPFLVARNDPDMGPVILRMGNRDVQFQCGDARHSLYIEALIAREIGSDNTALRAVLTCVASLPAGRPAMTFGCAPTK
eukprot:5169994-Pyramimonas_sp.AAC.1